MTSVHIRLHARPSRGRLAAILLPLAAAACSSVSNYPSLAIRDAERAHGTATAPSGNGMSAVPDLPPATADLTTQLKGLSDVAEAADHEFQGQRGAAENAVAAAGEVASESWSTATIALGALQASRAQAMTALAQLDTLYATARDEAPTEESPAAETIGLTRAHVESLIQSQDATIDRLSARLRG